MSEQIDSRRPSIVPAWSGPEPSPLLQQLGLDEDPFSSDPLAGTWVALEPHEAVLAAALRWLDADPGIASGLGVVGAGPGLGKTRLLGQLVAQLANQVDRLIGVFPNDGTRRSDAQLVRSALLAFGGEPSSRTGLELTTELRALLADHVADRRDPVLLVDYAALTGSQLEILRTILARRASGEQPHVQIVLLGPPELVERIARRRALAGFVHLTERLEPLDRSDVRALVRGRLQGAQSPDSGDGAGSLISDGAIARIWTHSGGVPGAAIALARQSLVDLVARQLPTVEPWLVDAAAAEQPGAGARQAPASGDDAVLQTRLTLPGLDGAAGERRRGQQQ